MNLELLLGKPTESATNGRISGSAPRSAACPKNHLYWQTRLGVISVTEQTFTAGKGGSLMRPFSWSAQVYCRSYSLPLQRVIVDFGADVPFGRIPEKLREHYGIEVPVSSAQAITQAHAERVHQSQTLQSDIPNHPQVEHLIVEMDGTMIPIVETTPGTDAAGNAIARRNLLDFYHLSQYLAAASVVCAPTDAGTWLDNQQDLLKSNQWQQVLLALRPHLEPPTVADEQAPVRSAYRYMNNRPDQLDYQGAITQALPIGSGEIESAHRSVILDRLDIPGAWWTVEKAEELLSLRVLRENQEWDGYWTDLMPNAA